MRLNCEIDFVIGDNKYTYRTLDPDDVTISYVNSLKEERLFLQNIPPDIDVNKQMRYVQNILVSPDDTICGLFSNGNLIGTAGIQNLLGNNLVEIVDGYTKNCTVGIFVLSTTMRGMGYGKSLVWLSCMIANRCFGSEIFEACMKKTNFSSLNSFLTCGFTVTKENNTSLNVTIDWKYLKQPSFINNVVLTNK